jgi:glycosyltransferase involved in cell wall biosynthesis
MSLASKSGTSGKRILYIATEDWFFRSHFLPMARAAMRAGFEVILAARLSDAARELTDEGIQTIPIDLQRGALNPAHILREAIAVRRLLKRYRPDILHLIALKPMLVGNFGALLAEQPAVVNHVGGVGFVGVGKGAKIVFARRLLWLILRTLLARRNSWVLVENDDDGNNLGRYCRNPVTRVGGAGVDPDHFTALPPPSGNSVSAAVVSRMLWSKGIDTVVEAQRRLWHRGVRINLTLAGRVERGLPNALSKEVIDSWAELPGIRWIGHQPDVRTIWRDADIAVLASRGGEGIPRVLLEAAACGRPIITTDVPGCRDFVRTGVEGLVIPPDDPDALADALERLAGNPELRHQMGHAARARVLGGHTENQVSDHIVQLYKLICLRQKHADRTGHYSRKRAIDIVDAGLDQFAKMAQDTNIRGTAPEVLLQRLANCMALALSDQKLGRQPSGRLIGAVAHYSWRYLRDNIESADSVFGLGSRIDLMQWNLLLEQSLIANGQRVASFESI